MKKLLTFLFITGFLIFGISTAYASQIDFLDTTNHWKNWGNGGPDDGIDGIGSPGFTGGSIFFNDNDPGVINKITFDFVSSHSTIKAGDLFIDLGADEDWDYVVTAGGSILKFDDGILGLGSQSDGGADDYIISNETWGTGSYRELHPVFFDDQAITSGYANVGTATVQGSFANAAIDIEFDKLSIDTFGSPFIIGFSPTCANDVIYEKIPEPATMLLVGSCLIGLAVIRRKKFLK